MLALLFTAVVTCVAIESANCDKAIELKKEILQMKENTKFLTTAREELNLQVIAAKEKCQKEIAPLERERDLILEKNKLTVDKLEEISLNITEKNKEEELLVSALNREFYITNKYQLKITLYKQDLEFLTIARKTGIAGRCPALKPKFEKYGTSMTLRAGGQKWPLKSEKDYLIVLLNQLNSEKIIFKRVKNQNLDLKNELMKINDLCAAKKLNLREIIQFSKDELQQALENLDLVERDLSEAIKAVEKLTNDLEERRDLNHKLQVESLELKEEINSFSVIRECFTTILNYDIKYKEI